MRDSYREAYYYQGKRGEYIMLQGDQNRDCSLTTPEEFRVRDKIEYMGFLFRVVS